MPDWSSNREFRDLQQMSNKITGACLCGTVRFVYSGELGAAAYCHCEDCRRCTGSAFNVSVAFQSAFFDIVSGTPKGYTKRADSGNELTRHFCPDCGSPVYTSSPRHPDLVYTKAGALDDPIVVVPAYQSWAASAVPWATIESGLPAYEKGRSRG
jgi:hypothetical protein